MPQDVRNIYRYDRVTREVLLVSVDVAGNGNGDGDSYEPSISADGNVIAFTSQAANLHADDTDSTNDVFARNMATGTTHLLTGESSVNSGSLPVVSANGNVIVFIDSNEVWAFNLATATVQLVSVDTATGLDGANASVFSPQISADGSVVVFHTAASNLHPLDTNGITDVYARNLATGITYLVSVNAAGTAGGDANSLNAVISADGTVVAFESYARNLDPLDADTGIQSRDLDVYARNLATETTYLVSVDKEGTGSGNYKSNAPTISADGRMVAFESEATNIVAMDGSADNDIYAYDLQSAVMYWVSDDFSTFVDDDANEDDGFDDGNWDVYDPMINGDGSVVVYRKGEAQIAARNLVTGRTQLVSMNIDGSNWGNASSDNPSISADGRVVVFESEASNLVASDFPWNYDVFVATITWEPPALRGDYNNDGYVDTADYVVWRKKFGSQVVQYGGADGDGDRIVDQDDHGVWLANVGKHSASIHFVDTLEDESDGDFSAGHYSLREAIAAANSRPGTDAIFFSAALTAAGPATIFLAHGELMISDWLTINGLDDERLTIDAQHQSRIFNVSQISGDVTLRGLTLTGGRTTGSGEYYDDLSYAGGTIRSLTSGKLTIAGTTIRDSRTLGRHSSGGAVFSGGELEIIDSVVTESGTEGYSSDGGAILSYGPLVLIDSSITNNEMLGEEAIGGAITAYEGGVVYNSIVSGNRSLHGSGGAIATYEDLLIYGSVLSNNQAGGRGGAVSGGLILIADSVFTDNQAAGRGGAVSGSQVIIEDSEFRENNTDESNASGGAIYGSRVTVVGSIVAGNWTLASGSAGGGVFGSNEVIIERSTIAENYTFGDNSRGGGVYGGNQVSITDSLVSGNWTAGANSAGGGIFAGNLTLFQSTISGNRTQESGSHGGGIAGYSTATMRQSTITDNHVMNAAATGGGVWMNTQAPRTMTMAGTIVGRNTAGGGNPDIRPAQTLIASYSLIGDKAGTSLVEAPVGSPDANGNLIGGMINGTMNPMLGLLADNGGPTMTHALLPGSPAIDAGDSAAAAGGGDVPEYDQRGVPFTRVYGGRIDIGALEVQALPPAAFGDYNQDGAVDAGDDVVWHKMLDTIVAPYTAADGNGNGIVDQADRDVWTAHFGQTAPVSAATASTGLALDQPQARSASRTARQAGSATLLPFVTSTSGTSSASPAVELSPKAVERRAARGQFFAPRVLFGTLNHLPARHALGAGSTPTAIRHDDALVAWLASQSVTREWSEQLDAFRWSENEEAGNIAGRSMHSIDQAFTLLASD
jgi:predicted outer membrane repeat protein